MPVFTKKDITFLFIHIPKTGGTSIEYFFIDNGFSVKWFVSSFSAWRRQSSPQHRDRETILERLEKESIDIDFSFAVVRHPVDRLLSEYFQQCRNEDRRSKRLTSRDFAFWVDEVFRLHQKNPVYFDNHIRPQSEFLLDDTMVYHYENEHGGLLEPLVDLDKKYGLELDFNLLANHKQGHNKRPIEIREETLRKIYLFYKADFEKLYPSVDFPRDNRKTVQCSRE